MLKYTLLSLTVLATGCSTLNYQEPSSGERARVRFVSDLPSIAVLRHYDDSACKNNEQEWLRLQNKDGLVRSTPKRLGMPLWNYHVDAAKEVYVETSRSHTFLFSGGQIVGSTIYECGVPLTLQLEPERDYEVYFRWSTERCTVAVSELKSLNEGATAQPLKTFTNQASPETEGCLAQFKKKRLY